MMTFSQCVIAVRHFTLTSLSPVVMVFIHSTVNLVSATAMPEAATMMLLWTHFLLSTAGEEEESVTTASTTQQIGGQCDCKRHVSGRQCLRCQDGFYDLQALDPDGCCPCNCKSSGTVDGDITCHQNSGQCLCEVNVIGLPCNHCNFGCKFLQSFNDDGCQPCQYNPHGSVNQLCNPLSGQCECKKEAKGLKCDTCREDFYGLAGNACKACDCSLAGSQAGTTCDAETGQCVCESNVGGRRCNQCLEGYFSLQQKDSFLCLPCNCEKIGTVHGSLLCDKSTGQCLCKSGVTGLRCNQCAPHRFNLTMGNLQGCQVCECDSLGTLPGSICDPVSGQCPCLPHRQGRRCEQ